MPEISKSPAIFENGEVLEVFSIVGEILLRIVF